MPADQPIPPDIGKMGSANFFIDDLLIRRYAASENLLASRLAMHDRRESQSLLILSTLFSAETIALLLSLPTMIIGSFWNVLGGPKSNVAAEFSPTLL